MKKKLFLTCLIIAGLLILNVITRQFVFAGEVVEPTVTYVTNGGTSVTPSLTMVSAFGDPNTITSLSNLQDVFLEDLDNDGDLDVIANSSNLHGSVYWYENDGTGTFDSVSPHLVDEDLDNVTCIDFADFDNDGDLDIILPVDYDKDIYLYENDGTGSFSAYQIVASPANNISVVGAEDIDGDGWIDILSAGSEVSWYMNNGNGTFGAEQVISTMVGLEIDSVDVSDVDNDGELDVLVASAAEFDYGFYLYINSGSGVFASEITLDSGLQNDGIASAEFVDLDEDGDEDILTFVSDLNQISWYENNGLGNYGLKQVIFTESASDMLLYVTSADIDKDGDFDLVKSVYYSDNTGDVTWLENNGLGDFIDENNIVNSVNYIGMVKPAFGDINADGTLDLITSNIMTSSFSSIDNLFGTVYKVNTPADPIKEGYSFDDWYIDVDLTESYDFSTGISDDLTLYAGWDVNEYTIHFVDTGEDTIADITQDFGTDVNGPDDPTWPGYTFMGWMADPLSPNDMYEFTTMPAEDLRLYGKWNVTNFILYYHLDGGTHNYDNPWSYTKFTTDFVLEAPTKYGSTFDGWYLDSTFDTEITKIDTSSYSDYDLYAKWIEINFVEDGRSEISSYEINKVDGFDVPQTFGTINNVSDIYQGDIDGDGDLDIVTFDGNNPVNFYWYENNGSNQFNIEHVIDTDLEDITDVQLGDMDNDGDLDIVYVGSSWDEVSWYENDGTGVFGPMQRLTDAAQHPQNLDLADLNGDGYLDILSAGDESDALWFENNGDGTFEAAQTISSVSDTPIDIVAADFDGDGFIDVAVGSDKHIDWYANDGSGNFTWVEEVNQSVLFLYDLKAADIDSDGDIDLISTSTNDFTISWYENIGGSLTTQHIVDDSTNLAASSYIVDFDGDNHLDIVTSFVVFGDTGKLVWYENDGLGGFNGPIMIYENGLDVSAIELVVDDFDFDGDLDIVAAGYNLNTIIALDGISHTYILTEPSEPTRPGYTFTGWYSDSELTESYDFNSTFSSDLTLYADWDVNEYTISFEENGGSTVLDIDGDFGTSVEEPSDPTRTGYTFIGWYSDSEFNTPYSFSTMPTEDITLYADWNINKYTVEYVDYNGTVLQTEDFDYNADLTEVTAPIDPRRTGYTYAGWDSTLPATMPTSDITITATYTINQYTVEYVDYNGTVLQTEDFDYNTDLTEVTAPIDPRRTGYTYAGWDSTLPATMPASDITITATYTINQYTVEYVDYDGTVLQTADYDYGTSLSFVTQPESPSRAGYTFNGWDSLAPDFMSDTNITITATYTINQYTVEYVDYNGTVLQTEDFDYNADLTEVTAPSDPSRTGYTYAGWDSTLPATMPAIDITITATYTINQYTIVFEENGGTDITDITQDYLSSITEPDSPKRTGYTFNGWFIDSDLSSEYTFNQIPLDGITLYAKWLDSEKPIISSDGDIEIDLSNLDDFIMPSIIISDNEDSDLIATIQYFNSDMTVEFPNEAAFIDGLRENCSGLIRYQVSDSSGNISDVYEVIVSVHDDVCPEIYGIEDETIYESGSVIEVSFNEGTATLNGEPIENGTEIKVPGIYELVVVDEFGNMTTTTFTIESSVSFWWIWTLSAIIIVSAVGYYFRKPLLKFSRKFISKIKQQ